MKILLNALLQTDIENPLATQLDCTFIDDVKEEKIPLTFVAKESQFMIKTKLKKEGFTNDEINLYTVRIKSILNQFNEADDFPSIAIAQ